jgi:hypothetical protein
MPSTIQIALILESVANTFGATLFTFLPNWCLSKVLIPSPIFPNTLSTTVPPSAITLLQAFGTIVYALTVPLLLCIPEGPHAAHARRIVYLTLGAGEAFLVPLCLVKAFDAGSTGFTARALFGAAGNLVPVLAWRVYALWGKPALLTGANINGKKKA